MLEATMGSVEQHRARARRPEDLLVGEVRYSPLKSLWFSGMVMGALAGAVFAFSWLGLLMFLGLTAFVLLFGHSLGSHRKLIHDSFECPKWLEYVLVYCGVQVGLAGPLGLLRQHELRDYAQRLPTCHPYLRHGSGFWRDAWWQLHCELHLRHPPEIRLEKRIGSDRFYRFLERTWMLQQLPPALLLYALGGWALVAWGVCARVAAGVLGHWLIGYFAHNQGGIHHEVKGAAVQGRNIPLTSLLTMGESWHNNHHAFPGSARLGLYAGEWDPGWWTLLLLQRLGLVRHLRTPSDLPPRAELVAVSAAARGADRRREQARVGRSRLREVWRLCAGGVQLSAAEGPAATLPLGLFQGLAGRRVTFRHRPDARRLRIRVNGETVIGLPAFCVLLAAGAWPVRLLALALAPAAVAVEALRARWGAA